MKTTNLHHVDSLCRMLTRIGISASILFASVSAMAQSISGPSEAVLGTRQVFQFVDEGNDSVTWTVSNGAVYSTNHPNETLYEAVISFEDTTGVSQIFLIKNGDTISTHSVVVVLHAPPTPNAYILTGYKCGTTQVVAMGMSWQASYSWWWQTSPNGTNDSTENNADNSFILAGGYTLTESDSLWLRARFNAPPYTWSTESQFAGYFEVFTTRPAAPTTANHASRIGPGPITVSVGAVSGALTYVWYTQAEGGNPIYSVTTNTYEIDSLLATQTYYVASKTEGCESETRLAVTASILPWPTITVSSINGNVASPGQPVVLATTVPYSTYTWKSASGTVVGTSSTYSTTAKGSYTVTVTASSSPNTAMSDPFSVIIMISGSVLDGLSFQYKYDHRNRMTHKRVPGADWVYMVYDDRDRLVMTQDGNQRLGNRWTYTKYDAFNRPIMTGIYTHGSAIDQAAMSALVSTTPIFETYNGVAATEGYTNNVFPMTGTTLLTVTYYDDYSFRSLWSGTWTYLNENLMETVNGVNYPQPSSEFTRVVGKVTGTKTRVLDDGTTPATWLKSISYYDDRNRLIQTVSDNYEGGIDRVTNVLDFAGKVLKVRSTHSRITWKDVVGLSITANKMLAVVGGWGNAGAASVEQLAPGQDGWVSATVSNNSAHLFGLSDVNTNANLNTIDYAFYMSGTTLSVFENGASKATISGALVPGELLQIERVGTVVRYRRNGTIVYTSTVPSSTVLMADCSMNGGLLLDVRASFTSGNRFVTRKFEYDHAGRLLKMRHQLSTIQATEPEVILVQNEYNELGQLVDKKLHSTDGTTFKQSVDQRYNIRGWLTSINNSKLEPNGITNDDGNDLFGMELKYNTVDADIANTALFNGNISGVKWSNYPGTGTTKEKGYTYSYDPMSRLSGSVFKERTTDWTTPANNVYAETGFAYDLNGNILSLSRNDGRTTGTAMDVLSYSYTNSGNKLLRVTDGGDDFKGFVDGTNTGDDYTYDANGNMTRDLNKGIGNSLTDATNVITYNYLNLPETITKGGNNVRYIYDATGRKLSQLTTFGGHTKQTDYAGEYVYENDALQFINHEEGRIVVGSNTLVYSNPGESLTDFTAVSATLALVTMNGTEKYVRVTSSGTTARTGVFPIGGNIPVVAGEKYRIRVKGYFTGNSSVHIQAKASGVDIAWPGAKLASNVASESWTEQVVIIPPAATYLQVGVNWNTVTAGQIFYLNEIEVTKLSVGQPEYQYHLKDHLGNVRTTFTSVTVVDPSIATLETANLSAEQGKFLRIATAKRVSAAIFDKTNGTSTGFSERLNGSANEKYGVAKSISVMPGDVIQAEVYGKYVDQNSSNWTGALTTLMSQIAANTAGVVFDGASYGSSTSSFPFAGLLSTAGSTGGPKAYLNWLIFDKNYTLITGGYQRMSAAPKEQGQDVAHELMSSPTINITQAGFVYIYLSNEETTPVEVYFDDFKVTHTKSPVVQSEDYYPFGLSISALSYQRENSTAQDYKYNGKEIQDELALNIYDFGFRQYDPALARWNVVDPLAEKRYWMNPYNYVQNNPMNNFDPNGLTDFTLNKKTGDVKKVGEDDSNPDRIVKTRKDGSVKRKGEGFLGGLVRKSKRGDPKTAVGDIAKGILKDGQNFRTQNNIFAVGGEGQPAKKDVEIFALKLSNYVGKEIGGAYFGGENTTHMTIGMYAGNEITKTRSSGHILGLRQKLSLTGFFHTHPSNGYSTSDRTVPSDDDLDARDAALLYNPALNFFIITEPEKYGDEYPLYIPYRTGYSRRLR